MNREVYSKFSEETRSLYMVNRMNLDWTAQFIWISFMVSLWTFWSVKVSFA